MGQKEITSTSDAMKERMALIWFSCFCCASENWRVTPAASAAALMLSVLAVRHSLSEPTWANPRVMLSSLPASALSAPPSLQAARDRAIAAAKTPVNHFFSFIPFNPFSLSSSSEWAVSRPVLNNIQDASTFEKRRSNGFLFEFYRKKSGRKAGLLLFSAASQLFYDFAGICSVTRVPQPSRELT